MDAETALTKNEAPAPIATSSLPDYFSSRLRRREQERNDAAMDVWDNGYKALFCSFVAVVSAGLCSWGWVTANMFIWALCATVCVATASPTLLLSWRFGERVKYLYGTRDETRYLPAGCRSYAEQEARLLIAAETYNADIVKWRETIPLLEEHGDARHWAAAEKARATLETKREALVNASARLWTAAASSEDPAPRRTLPSPATPKALPPPNDWGPVDSVDLQMESYSRKP